jgi:hypothetical protein
MYRRKNEEIIEKEWTGTYDDYDDDVATINHHS